MILLIRSPLGWSGLFLEHFKIRELLIQGIHRNPQEKNRRLFFCKLKGITPYLSETGCLMF
jgi:hypothetical protein